MIKKVFGVVAFVILVMLLGIHLENKIKENLNKIDFSKVEKVEVIKEDNVNSSRETAVVLRVVDGDTIELSDKRKVRYIGVNAPEMTDKRAEILCFAKMAKAENQKLVEGKTIEMEKDVSETDKYDRLLRYVWIDNQMVNETLIKEGLAKTATYPPDVKYKQLFLDAEKVSPKITCKGF